MSRTALPLALALLCASSASAQTALADTPSIVTQGEASLRATPDLAWVSMAVEGRAGKAASAQQKAAQAMTALQTALQSLSIPAAAIKTTGYSLAREYGNTGDYVARNQIEIRVDDFDKLSAVIDSAGVSGAASMTGLRFDVKDRANLEMQALSAAVKDALARADAMARGAGKQVGPILKVQEQRMAQPIGRTVTAMAGGGGGRGGAGVPTPVESGEIEIRALVTMTVAIR
jgi:uncharacterized protein YggE